MCARYYKNNKTKENPQYVRDTNETITVKRTLRVCEIQTKLNQPKEDPKNVWDTNETIQ